MLSADDTTPRKASNDVIDDSFQTFQVITRKKDVAMERTEQQQQESIRRRLTSRANGFLPFEVLADETIPSMFAKQVSFHPHKPAIVSRGKTVTYAELSRLSCEICSILVDETDKQKYPIALLISQHSDLIGSILGVLRSGGFYVPLDATFPLDRNIRILHESDSRIVLTERSNQHLIERLSSQNRKVIYVDELLGTSDEALDLSKPNDLASVIFTSGSTGAPKGVVQTHRNLLQVVRRFTSCLGLGLEDRVSLLSSCSVTAFLGSSFSALLNGATLCGFSVLEEGLTKLADWIDSERITEFFSVPSLFRHFMESLPPERIFKTVQIVRLGGDSLYKSDWELFKLHFPDSCVLVNLYGCSELSTLARFYMDATSQLPEGILPVGYPLDDVEVFVKDDDGLLHQVSSCSETRSPSVTGEIILSSPYLSPGYWNDIATTERAFTTGDRTRTYSTGDFGSVRRNHGLVHLGRQDLQTKVSGYRVEVAEVEGCLRSYPGVKEAAILMNIASTSERELIGFVMLKSETQQAPDIRQFVQDRLPPYMVPSEILVVPEIPHTPNGKIDRGALVDLRKSAQQTKLRRRPSNGTEELLSEIWRHVLALDQIGVDDNFFELGGNSVIGMKLAVKISEALAIQVPIHSIYRHPTITQLAPVLEQLRFATATSAVAEQVNREESSA